MDVCYIGIIQRPIRPPSCTSTNSGTSSQVKPYVNGGMNTDLGAYLDILPPRPFVSLHTQRDYVMILLGILDQEGRTRLS